MALNWQQNVRIPKKTFPSIHRSGPQYPDVQNCVMVIVETVLAMPHYFFLSLHLSLSFSHFLCLSLFLSLSCHLALVCFLVCLFVRVSLCVFMNELLLVEGHEKRTTVWRKHPWETIRWKEKAVRNEKSKTETNCRDKISRQTTMNREKECCVFGKWNTAGKTAGRCEPRTSCLVWQPVNHQSFQLIILLILFLFYCYTKMVTNQKHT